MKNDRYIKKLISGLLTLVILFSSLISCSPSGNSAHKHTFASSWVTNDEYHWHPSTCGHDVKANEEKHNFISTVTKPTYEKGGYTTYKCSTCGYSYVDNETKKLEHNYSSSWSYDENSHWHACTDGGYGDLKKDESSHNFTFTVTDPTYEEGGYTTYTCSTCGYSYVDDETEKLEHNYSSSWSYDENSHWHACTDEGYEHHKKDESLHNFTSTVTDPTYEEGGYRTYTCSTCGYSYVDDEADPLFVTITWKNYDGTILEIDNDVKPGTMPTYDGEEPIKESDDRYNYTFAGWTPEVVIATKDETYTAAFSSEEITYTIDFNLNGGTSSSYKGSIEVTTFSKDIFFFDCVKEGWQFRGREYNGEKIFDEKGNQLKNITLVDNIIFKAIYSQTVKLTITTNMPEAGTITGEGEYPYNTYVDASVTPNQGYKFVGWYYQNTLLSNEKNYKYMMWDIDITLEARFEKDDFYLKIYTSNENYGLVLLKSNSVIDEYLPEYTSLKKYGSEVTIAAYSKNDVRFLGRYDENNVLVTTNAVYTFVMPNYDYTLEAKWDYFTINYNLNGGVNNQNNPTYYKLSDDIISLESPTKEGYTFLGWKCNDEIIETINPHEGKNIILEAMWGLFDINQDINGKYASIIAFDKTISDVIIPESINVYGEVVPVKVINNSVFENNDTIVSIIIPDSVTNIGESAFSSCSNLETLTISENSQLEEINVNVFENCTKLNSIYIPNSVTTIKERAFYHCALLTTINIPNSVTTIEASAFADCSSLTSIYIPNSVTAIGEYAFQECSNLASVTIEENSPLTKIETGVFRNCSSLVTFNIPNNITTIGESAFSNCSSLQYINIPNSVRTIEYQAFYDCVSLTSIYIPNSVVAMEDSIFYSSPNLIIYCGASSKPSGWDSSWNNSNLPVVWSSYLGIHGVLANFNYVVCLDNNGDKYIIVTEYTESVTYVVIPEFINIDGEDVPIKEIGEEVFSNNKNLISIVIPDNVTTIGNSAFNNCSNLKTITISENSQLTTIGEYAFNNCSSLTSINVPDCVTTIGKYAFNNCSSLISINVPDSVTTIGEYAFNNCSSLTSINIPDSVTTIGERTFSGCSNLESVTISENSQLTTIGEYAFSSCSSLALIYIPISVTSIGEYTFKNCSSLKIYCEVDSKQEGWSKTWNDSNRPVIWNSYKGIYGSLNGLEYAVRYDEYENLYIIITGYNGSDTDVIIPEYIVINGEQIPVKEISNIAFINNTEITSINIPDGVISIADNTFEGCSNLTTITISENSQLTTIGEYAFSDCSSLTSIFIPDSVTTIDFYAFNDCSNLTIYCEASSEPSGWDSYWNSSNQPVIWNSYKGIYGNLNGLEYVARYDEDGNPYIAITEYNGSNTDVVIPEYIEVNGEQIIVKEIASSAFRNNETITSIVIPDSVTTIGEYAFYDCFNLEFVTISENSQLTTIGERSFYNCDSLTSIYIPDSVTTIGEEAFYDCFNLEFVTISENSQLTTISFYAFYNCDSLTSIYIPDSVTTIEQSAFIDCSNLTIYCEASSEPSGWDSYWNYSDRPIVWNITYDEYLEAIA